MRSLRKSPLITAGQARPAMRGRGREDDGAVLSGYKLTSQSQFSGGAGGRGGNNTITRVSSIILGKIDP